MAAVIGQQEPVCDIVQGELFPLIYQCVYEV